MKRFGENVFQFNYSFGVRGELSNWFYFFALSFILPILSFLIIIYLILMGDLSREPGLVFLFIVFFILSTYWTIAARRYLKSGVILDNEKGIITLYKWTWNIRETQKFEEIHINEIMGIDRDIDVRTETKLSGNTWQTTESRGHNIVLQGKFGTRRFTLADQDDWNLFMTLLYGEEQ